MPEMSDVRLIQKDSESLRTTVPSGVRAALDLKPRDQLEWNIIAEGNDMVVKLRKLPPRRTPEELMEDFRSRNANL